MVWVSCGGGGTNPVVENQPASGAGEFEFDIATPLFRQIQAAFAEVDFAELSPLGLAALEGRPAVYGLEHGGQLVYVGKADEDVRSRLRKHRRLLMGRSNMVPDQVRFRCVYLARTWDPFKPEGYLIRHYRTREFPGWNGQGFGSNDPGRNRDHTDLGEGHWHVRFPLDPDWPCDEITAGRYEMLELLTAVKESCPFWVRFQGHRQGRGADSPQQHAEARTDFQAAAPVDVPARGMAAKDLLLLAVQALPRPDEWQLTQLPSHLLLYKERDASYPRMRVLWAGV